MNITELLRREGYKRGLRTETIKTYIVCCNKFFRTIRKDPKEITKKDIYTYLDQRNLADNTVNVYLNALKFFYEKVLHKKLTVKIEHKRVRKQLPEFLTPNEITKLFEAIVNNKQKLIVKLLYATGMRVAELVKLKVGNFEFNNNYGWIRDGKGGKDRLFIVATKLKQEIINWIATNKLNRENWLFLGNNGHYSASSIRLILKEASKKAGIKKNVHPHTLRHSFATHLIENGYAVTEVQPLLGHNSLSTTMIYLHMASPQLLKVQSPFDNL